METPSPQDPISPAKQACKVPSVQGRQCRPSAQAFTGACPQRPSRRAVTATCPLEQQSSSSSRCSVMAMSTAGKLGSTSLFGESTSSLLGGNVEATVSTKPKLDEVPLLSDAGMDYSTLRKHLQAGDFRQADDETRAMLIKLAGEAAVKRGWVYFSEIKSISSKDLQTMDALWRTASDGKFGFSVQREMWNQNQKRWAKFFKQIGWTQGENNIYLKWPMEFIYSMDAVRGHLPLTNALRGTQLFQALLEHPAFEKTASKRSIDDVTKEQSQSASKLFN